MRRRAQTAAARHPRERDYDIAGEQAQRVQMLYTMYLECLVTGHALQKRGRRAVS